ncbi:hypothetical protein [Kordiimonas sp. SCSIO 12610]|uniref:hypothetical protein n=1 Tax=Kordiimonas sp. SCSIO 12610 TaxID=2829597 RepID=UPI0021093686|nr:hypothetical protein [Kordiimonas sp. SCSIO 12610]UTW55981.1 hypothetical protein KFF44_03560 [Kordiimonas sp. SCSIO 12610]
MSIEIEGAMLDEILKWPEEIYDALVLIDRPIVVKVGTAEVLGQFVIESNSLVIELAQIDGGGEGVLPAINRIARRIAGLKKVDYIDCIVHAVNCVDPNLKLRSHLLKTGFQIRDLPHKGEAYFKRITL